MTAERATVWTRGVGLALGLMTVCLLLGACTADESPAAGPTSSFPRDVSDTRVYTAYRQSTETRSARLDFAPDSRFVRVRIECSADTGLVRITIAGRSRGAMGCGRPVQGGSLSFPNPGRFRGAEAGLTIRAPRGSSWSMAVDTRSRPFDPLQP